MRTKKIVAFLLAFTMLVSGFYILAPETKEVQAEETMQGGGNLVEPNEVAEGMLDVKMQTRTNDDGSVSLRLVSSVNGLGYINSGFEVYLDADNDKTLEKIPSEYIKFTTKKVAKRVDASKTGVTYNYSPKVIDTDAEYFVTGTLEKINSKYLEYDMCVRAYCTTMDGQVVYGTGRYFNIADATSGSIVNIPVKMDAAPTTEEDGAIKDVDIKIGGKETTATLEKYDADGYAHVNVTVPDSLATDKTKLPSASKVEVGTDSAIYRNLLSDYTGVGTEDTSWYTVYEAAGETEFVIATDADLYGFATLGASKNFSGDTIYMIADIDANIGRATKDAWLTTAEDGTDIKGATAYQWTSLKGGFSGTFDGQMHTISGIYFQKESLAGAWGLFRETGECTVRNLILTNSYMGLDTSQNVQFGSIAGKSNGTFDTIKIAEDVYLKLSNSSGTINNNACTGGIVGYITGSVSDKKNVVNCWFDGQITSGGYVGGILGSVQESSANDKKPIKMTNCLNSGMMNVNQDASYFGGLCGSVNYARLVIDHSVNVSTVNKNNFTVADNNMGSGVAYVSWNSNGDTDPSTAAQNNRCTVTMNNTYLLKNTQWTRVAYKSSKGSVSIEGESYTGSGAVSAAPNYLPEDSFIGENGYLNFNLDFTVGDILKGYWSTTATGTPVLSSFVDVKDTLALDKVNTPRTLWYTSADTDTYTLYTKADMYGFASLEVEDAFEGKTIKLGADITMNEGTTSDWEAASYADLIPWTARDFAGTFDGGNHTINGVYLNSTTGNVGLFATVSGTVQNLKILNSYFNCTDKSTASNHDALVFTAPIGSVAGTLSGTIDKVYSDAIVKHAGAYAGGLVGAITSTRTENTITNCCYVGSISANSGIGGLLGVVANANATIEHCLNAGTINGGASSAGLCGLFYNNDKANNYVLNLKDSLNVGKSNVQLGSSSEHAGSVVGYVRNANGEKYPCVVATNTYGLGEAEDVEVWKMFAYGSNNGQITVDDNPASTGNVYHNRWTLTNIINKITGAGTKLNLSFQIEEGDNTNNNYWVARDGEIPMLACFEDLLKDLTLTY